jgi:hypothetical protein
MRDMKLTLWPSSPQKCGAALVWGLIYLVPLITFAALVKAHITQNPLRADEVDYYQSMVNVFTLGLPLYYAGEVYYTPEQLLHLSTRPLGPEKKLFHFYRFRPETGVLKETFFALTDDHSRYTYAMWHPPLYVYLGALFLRLFPFPVEASAQIRYFNLIFTAGILAGMAALSRQLYPGQTRPTLALAFILYGLNNLAIRGTILIDYNATLAPCVAMWFAIAYLQSTRHQRGYLGLGLTALAAFATSLGLIVTLLIGTAIHLLILSRRNRPWRTLFALAAGTLTFLPLFWIVCRLGHLPFSQPFLHNIQRAAPSLHLANLTLGDIFGLYAREVGYAPLWLGAGLTARLLLHRETSDRLGRAFLPLLMLTGTLIHGVLRAEAYGFPKYILFLLPWLSVYLAGESVNWMTERPKPAFARLSIGLALAIVIAWQGITSWKALSRPGGTLYFAGEQGILAIAHRVQEQTSPDETILSPKDVAFYAQRKFVPWPSTFIRDVSVLQDRLTRGSARVIAINDTLFYAVAPEVASFLDSHFSIEAQEGSFRILIAKETP